MNYSTKIPAKSQEETKKRIVRKRIRATQYGGYPIPPIAQKWFVQRPRSLRDKLADSEILILDYMVNLCVNFKFVYISQDKIAKALGICRKTVNKALGKLVRFGLVSSNYRHFKTCLYNVTSILWNWNIAQKLKDLIPSLFQMFLKKEVTQSSSYIKNSIFKNRYIGGISNYPKVILSCKKSYDNIKSQCSSFFISMTEGFNMNNHINEVREVIEAIKEIELSPLGKAMLSVFKKVSIISAHKKFQDKIKGGRKFKNPFAVLHALCKEYEPAADTSFSNPIFRKLREEQGFSTYDNPLLSSEVKNLHKGDGQKPFSYDKEALVKNLGKGLSNQTFMDVRIKIKSKTFYEICEGWRKNWKTQRENPKVSDTLSIDYARKCYVNNLAMHFIEIYLNVGIESFTEYLHTLIFVSQMPTEFDTCELLPTNKLMAILYNFYSFFSEERANKNNDPDLYFLFNKAVLKVYPELGDDTFGAWASDIYAKATPKS